MDLNFEEAMARITREPPAMMLKPIFSCLCSCHEQVKWYAVSAMGLVVTTLAEKEMEDARIVMRRFMWMLNDESGGIGWGVPEAMAEVMACQPNMAREYAHILVSFMREDGFYLEMPALQRGLMWGIGRLAASSLENRDLLLAKEALNYLQPYKQSTDRVVRGLAVRASLILEGEGLGAVEHNRDLTPIMVYDNGRFVPYTPWAKF